MFHKHDLLKLNFNISNYKTEFYVLKHNFTVFVVYIECGKILSYIAMFYLIISVMVTCVHLLALDLIMQTQSQKIMT